MNLTDNVSLFDLDLPVVGVGEGPLPLREPHPDAVANHIKLLMRYGRKPSAQVRMASKNPEPFVM